jgi:transcriptional regulator with XRE-family HTH domain
MRSTVFQRILDNTPKDVDIFVDWYADLVVRINQLLRENNISKKELAEKMDKKPSEISKWLSGEHNFTLRSLAKLSAELGEPLMEVPKKKAKTEFVEDGFICRVHTFVSYTKLDTKTSGKVWQFAEETEPYNEFSNAG